MSYGTWVLSGRPTIDRAPKTIQMGRITLSKCLEMVSLSIHINSQPLEGEFYVMALKDLQVDLVLGRHLAKVALDL